MKVIFLDIDGVLASIDYLSVTSKLRIKNPDEFGYDFDPRCVMNLERIILETEACIVISSCWKSMGIKKLKEMWELRKLPGEIVDITPEIPGKRGLEIKQWLNKNKNVTDYVILDDDNDMIEEQVDNFIKVNSEFGLSFKNSQMAIFKLGVTSNIII